MRFRLERGVLTGKPHQVTEISTGADGGIWSPDGKNIVFVSAVYPDCKDDACNKQRDEELKKSKVKAKIFSRLFYRHWSAFTEFKRSHLFVQSVEAPVSGAGNGTAAGTAATTPRDLTPGDHDVPPFSLGGQDMYAISPDGQEVAYTSNIDEVEATSTNNEIFVVPISGGTAKKISTSPGADTTPLYSPDGKYLAWRSQARAGFEADKWRLFVQDRQTGKMRDLTEKFDRSVGKFRVDVGRANLRESSFSSRRSRRIADLRVFALGRASQCPSKKILNQSSCTPMTSFGITTRFTSRECRSMRQTRFGASNCRRRSLADRCPFTQSPT